MGLLEARIINDLIGNRHLNIVVDLGCGEGVLGWIIRSKVNYLIGVDHNKYRLTSAEGRNVYDELVFCDIRDYMPPPRTEAVIMIEVIEHITKEDGELLLSQLGWVPIIVLTTPQKFSPFSFRNGHVSLWTQQDFISLGYETMLFGRPFRFEFFFGKTLLAYKGLS
ncbi:hypothetical protein ES702_01417 [subsurface metagenome]